MKFNKSVMWIVLIGVLTALGALPAAAAGPTATIKITDSAYCTQGTDPSVSGIPILNFSMAGDAPTAGSGAGGGVAGVATLSGLKVVRQIDACTITMFGWFVSGRHIPTVELRVYDANKIETMRMTLSGVIATEIVYAPGQEGVTFTCSRIELLYVPSNVRTSWDFRSQSVP